jgi:CHAD domain-containing protein
MPRNLLHALTARADAFFEHLPGALEGRARDTHQARVASRRLVEVLPLAGDAGARLARRVRDVRRALGAAREIDVLIDLVAEEGARHDWPPPLVARVRRHLDEVAKKRLAESKDDIERVDPAKLRRGIRKVGALVADMPATLVAGRLRIRREEREAALARAVAAAGALYDADRLHRVRIESKKLRYILEAAADASAARTGRRQSALKTVQEQLGRLHDLHELQVQIRAVEGRLVPGRGRIAHGLARMADDVEADCRVLHAAVLPLIRK